MPIVRVFWLISLTLVATTLPASARPAPPTKGKDATARKADRIVPPEETSSEQDDKARKPQRPPVPELWDGSSTRVSGKISGPVLIDALFRTDADVRPPPPAPRRSEAGRSLQVYVPHPTGWLIGHYAHAPPITA